MKLQYRTRCLKSYAKGNEMRRTMKRLMLLCIGSGLLIGCVNRVIAAESAVTAIDILLEPDTVMVQRAQAINQRLMTAFPNGFALDETHSPHISIVQAYVRTADLDKVYAATGRILAGTKAAGWVLEASRYYFITAGEIGLAGIVIEPTGDLLLLQKNLLDALAPYSEHAGTAAAFVTTSEHPEINQPTMDYVASFALKQSGANFNPHVTVGIAPVPYLKALLEEPFATFSFSPASAAAYQLGNFGTAMKKLKVWPLAP